MSFFEELKRRNVFRVGAAYAVASFVLLQVLDAVGEILELPDWGGKLILAVLAVGFFVAVFVAWAYELTPEGVKREEDVDRSQSITNQTGKKLNLAIIVLMAIAIGYLLVDKFYLTPGLDTTPSVAEQSPSADEVVPTVDSDEDATPAISRQSVAVLPFENRSRAEEDEFFVEGVHDDLLTSLARIGSLKVISRTSVGRYRGTEKSIPEIAAELGVATVMEGAVQRSGDTVRINVQLIDAKTDEHLWAEIFDREMTADNLFAIQSEISEAIAKALEATLSPEEQDRLNDRPTDNLAAYNAYLRGRQLMARRNAEDLDQAALEFQRAVELDPDFALAWVGISETALLRTGYSNLNLADSLNIQKEASEKALALDETLGEAYLGVANVAELENRHEDAEAAYLKAVDLSPGYATAWHWYATWLGNFPDRFADAGDMLRKALELDPLSSIIQINLADHYIQIGDYARAEEQLAKVEQLDPDFVSVYRVRAQLAYQIGKFDEQVRWLNGGIERDPGHLSFYNDLAFAHLHVGYLEPIDGIRERAADVSAESHMLGFMDMIFSVYRRNFDGALEIAAGVSEQVGNIPQFRRFVAYIHTLESDYVAARRALESAEPRYFSRETWRVAIEREANDACLAGFLMTRTGDEEMGTQLLQLASNYLANELPLYIDHADRYSLEDCWITLGNMDDALSAIETRVEHGHIGFWWWWRLSPIYEPLWGEPRFEAALQKVEDKVAVQRANLIAQEGVGT